MFGPADTTRFLRQPRDDGYYLIVSALVPNKCVDIAVAAFNVIGERPVIAGSGNQAPALKGMAKKNIEFLGWVDDDKIPDLYANCRALIFPGEEDFGLVPIEAMAAGKPVIAYGVGGVLETVLDGITGIFYRENNPQGLCDAVKRFSKYSFNPYVIRKHAAQFDRSIFREKMQLFIYKKMDEWQ
jgi:glycosyltransferase involved in cell wall biosynthesis